MNKSKSLFALVALAFGSCWDIPAVSAQYAPIIQPTQAVVIQSPTVSFQNPVVQNQFATQPVVPSTALGAASQPMVVVNGVVTPAAIVGYAAERRGLFGMRTVFRPLVTPLNVQSSVGSGLSDGFQASKMPQAASSNLSGSQTSTPIDPAASSGTNGASESLSQPVTVLSPMNGNTFVPQSVTVYSANPNLIVPTGQVVLTVGPSVVPVQRYMPAQTLVPQTMMRPLWPVLRQPIVAPVVTPQFGY